jgi:hypothetical protein
MTREIKVLLYLLLRVTISMKAFESILCKSYRDFVTSVYRWVSIPVHSIFFGVQLLGSPHPGHALPGFSMAPETKHIATALQHWSARNKKEKLR